MTHTTAAPAPAAPSFGFLGSFFGAVRDTFVRYRLYNETVRKLSALSDRELHDIGLARCEIAATAARTALAD